MTPVDQQYLKGNAEGVPGDCVRACVASILDLPLADVPHFVERAGHDWVEDMLTWCDSKGIHASSKRGISRDPWPVMVCGPSPRDGRHACVYQNGELQHDPHPSRLGLSVRNDVPSLNYFISWRFIG